MLTLILGRGKTGKSTKLLEMVRGCPSEAMSSRIILVPEQLSHQTERTLGALCGDSISFFAEVLSFTRLYSRVCAACGGGARASLDQAGRILTVRLALTAVQSRLKVFAAAALRPDFLESVVSMIDELKRYEVTPQRLQEASRCAEGALAQKLEELGVILGAYDAVTAQGAGDPRDKLTMLRQMLESSDYAENRYFFVDGFTDFSAQELGVLEALLRRGRSMAVTLPWSQDDPMFSPGQTTLARLLNMAKQAGIKTELVQADYARPLPAALTYLERHLFSGAGGTMAGSGEAVRVIPSEDRLSECRTCVAELRRLSSQGLRWREMAVAACDSAGYGPLMEQLCREAGVPLFTGVKTPAAAHPAAAFLLLALEAATEGMETEAVTAYLRTGYSGAGPDACDALENYAYIWSIRGTKWQRDWTEHPEGYDGRFDESTAQELAALNDARRQAVGPVLRLAGRLRAAGNTRGQMTAVYQFLEETELFSKIEAQIQAQTAAGDLEGAQETAQVWNTLVECLQQTVTVLGDTAQSGGELLQLLRTALGQYELGTIPALLDAVHFGGVDSIRGMEPRALYVLGADQGNLPQASSGGSLLTERERDAMLEMGIELAPDNKGALERQLLQIYSAFTAPTESLTVSWSAVSGGEQCQPSYLVGRLRRLFPEAETAVASLARSLTVESLAALYLAAEESGAAELAELLRRTARLQPELEDAIVSAKAAALARELTVPMALTPKLFGAPLTLTASRLDQLGKCPLNFFLNYGLKARPRKQADFDAAEFGTFMHYILEKSVASMQDYSLPLTQADSQRLIENYMGQYLGTRMQETEGLSQREQYLYQRNSREARQLLEDISREFSVSQFRPCAYELKFGTGKELGPLTVRSTLGQGHLDGTVDRVDLWRSPEGDYIRVVDYKTGSTKFDYTDLYGGVGMQLMLYLFALGSGSIPGVSDRPIPAGALYYPAKRTFVSADGPKSAAEADALRKARNVRRTGLLLDNEEVLHAMEEQPGAYLPVHERGGPGDYVVPAEKFDLLEQFIEKKMRGAVDQIYRGDFRPDPFYRGTSHDPCAFCDYQDVCQKDSRFRREHYRPTLKASEFWEKLGGEQDG